ncbi:NAD-dependent epimerase/dehydratase family protein [Adhaeribacter swui]|uniref:NAD-dependent epimerase/dehydratase family protein n=1 Tax=Adhaeribacter swui TaxID=2086471 RepID=A0A7G7GCT8_9BACT|nr:NAD-dependent epimerase/dehydratase family protein [Adhaeribacter swui]QNF34972.1 NAD-dependent epimerase/dehydratase family protein [Adhaeribacter swui]
MNAPQRILVTGSAGFIGHHLVMALVKMPYEIYGLDSLNHYYDPELKSGRLQLQGIEVDDTRAGNLVKSKYHENLFFTRLDLTDTAALTQLFTEQAFDMVINLAAQAGVRHSMKEPQSYVASNLVGFANLLECCRNFKIKHFLFASSSSVYGNNANIPFTTAHPTDTPVSFYAATKKANEVMAHSYAHLYKIPTTGLRFFTVYGPWGRPDMAYFSFTKAILEETPIKIYNHGNMLRDFTYVDDVVESITRLITLPPKISAAPAVPFKLLNVGNSKPEHLLELVSLLEKLLDKKAKLDLQPMPPGDVPVTYADVQELELLTQYRPTTTLEVGLSQFVFWYKHYYQNKYLPVR